MRKNKKKRIVVFDVDGTLYNTKEGIFDALEDVFNKYNLGSFDRENGIKFIGPPIKDSLIKFCNLQEKIAIDATNYYRKVYIERYISNYQIYTGVIELLEALYLKGFIISIATMKTEKQINKLLQISKMEQYFNTIMAASEDGKVSKWQMLEEICRIHEIEKQDVVMIGDTVGDKEAAKKAGINFIGVTYGFGFKDDDKGKEKNVNKVSDILEILIH